MAGAERCVEMCGVLAAECNISAGGGFEEEDDESSEAAGEASGITQPDGFQGIAADEASDLGEARGGGDVCHEDSSEDVVGSVWWRVTRVITVEEGFRGGVNTSAADGMIGLDSEHEFGSLLSGGFLDELGREDAIRVDIIHWFSELLLAGTGTMDLGGK